tara:strand:- start:95 stop:289 length:195 start_codon:yes stop_codon:yes gene_type:complete
LSSKNPELHEIVSDLDSSLNSPIKKIKEGDREFELLSVDDRIKLAKRRKKKSLQSFTISRSRGL